MHRVGFEPASGQDPRLRPLGHWDRQARTFEQSFVFIITVTLVILLQPKKFTVINKYLNLTLKC
jgi:hypothetical protein